MRTQIDPRICRRKELAMLLHKQKQKWMWLFTNNFQTDQLEQEFQQVINDFIVDSIFHV